MGGLNMRDNKVLANSAMISAIWDETKKDNIELLKPFVVYLLGINYKVNDEIDCDKIAIEMERRFSFINFPTAVLIKIFRRLKDIVNKNYGKYYLYRDIQNECEKFEEKQKKVASESSEVINSLMIYLKEKNRNFNDLTYIETQKLFGVFLEENGFTSVYDIKKLNGISKYKTSESNYQIARYIIEENEKDSFEFRQIYKIICGFMLSNTIYMQLENNNNESLKNLDCYLDSPFILNVLGYKTLEQNKSAKILIDLLIEKKAKIKCFKHNYEEVYAIIKAYKDNLHKVRDKTLEALDLKKYTEKDIDIILTSLEKIFKNSGIEIVDVPDYSDTNLAISEEELTKFLEEHYTDKEEKVSRIIEQDVKSIAAISRIRGNVKYNKIEKCKAIFITTSNNLAKYVNKCTNKREFEEIGYVITDVELTTVLWLKTFNKNPELPKMKLIENARMALEPTAAVMKNFIQTLEKMKQSGLSNDVDIVEDIQLNWYHKSEELMEKISGNEENINQEIVKGIFANENNELKRNLLIETEKTKILKSQINKKNKQIIETRNKMKENWKTNIDKFFNIISKILKLLIFVIFIILIIGEIIYLIVNVDFSKGLSHTIFICFFSIICGVFGFLDMIFPRFNKINKLIDKICKNISDVLYEKKIDRAQSKYPELFDIQDEDMD